MKLKQFISANRIKMTAVMVDTNPNMASDDSWMRSANHWRVTLRSRGRQFTTYFSQGSAICHEPTVADVLDCLASDAAGVENASGFEDWAGEYGYDTDSRKAERTFNLCQSSASKLRKLLGDDNYKTLLWNTERL